MTNTFIFKVIIHPSSAFTQSDWSENILLMVHLRCGGKKTSLYKYSQDDQYRIIKDSLTRLPAFIFGQTVEGQGRNKNEEEPRQLC